jgi:micrococcal nuclease
MLLLALAALLALRVARGPLRPQPVALAGTYRVQRVIDGDTLLLDGGTRVRLIGIDAPETTSADRRPEPLAVQAAELARRTVEGHDVRLELDRERLDPYGRTLAYVYAGDMLLNEEIIRAGFSRAETRFPFRTDMQRRFRAAESEARAAGRGIWSPANDAPPRP